MPQQTDWRCEELCTAQKRETYSWNIAHFIQKWVINNHKNELKYNEMLFLDRILSI